MLLSRSAVQKVLDGKQLGLSFQILGCSNMCFFAKLSLVMVLCWS